MEKRSTTENERSSRSESTKRIRKKSEYGRQLGEKQKIRELYGMRERQFRRFFELALRSKAATGEMLLSLLERRLDNIVFRLKMATTRRQARQIIVHGHILLNGKRVYSPSYLVNTGDTITIAPQVAHKAIFLENVIDKRGASGKLPEWLEYDKKTREGKMLRLPVRSDIQVPVEEHLIVELYSK